MNNRKNETISVNILHRNKSVTFTIIQCYGDFLHWHSAIEGVFERYDLGDQQVANTKCRPYISSSILGEIPIRMQINLENTQHNLTL